MSTSGHRLASRSSSRRERPKVPIHQRKRIIQACFTCRRRKLRCDGSQPCLRCLRSGHCCSFPEPSRPERSPSQVESQAESETAHGWQEARLIRIEASLRRLDPDFDRPHSGDERDVDLLENENQEDVHTDDGLRDLDIPAERLTVQNQGLTHFEGESSQWSFFSTVQESVTGVDGRIIPEILDDHQYFLEHLSSMPTRNTVIKDVLQSLPPRNVVDFLVTTFFRFCQSNYYFLHPRIFGRRLESLYQSLIHSKEHALDAETTSGEFLCVVFMALAMGSQYAHLTVKAPENDYICSSPEYTLLSNIDIPTRIPNPGLPFYNAAQKLLPFVISTCSMTSVQACVMMGTFLLSTSARDVSYTCLGIAVRMAISMGMHRSGGDADLDDFVQQFRNRLWWTIYTLDRKLSIAMGRPLSLDDSMIDAPLPAELKGLDVDGFPSSVQNQVAMAGICQIMSRIVKNVYTSQGSHVEGRRSFDVRVVRQLRQDLDDWRANLPGGLQLDVESPPDDLSRALIHIHLTHQQAIILLTRSFAQFYIGQEKQSSIDQPGMKFLRQSTIDCIHAARVTIHLMVLLRKQKLLSQYSFFDALYCSAALYVLFLSTKLSPPDDKTRELMREALSILWQLAHGSAFAATSLKTMTSKGFRDSHESIDGVVSYDGRDNRRSRGEMVSAPSISSFESAAKSPPATTLSTQEQGFEYYNPPGLWSTLTNDFSWADLGTDTSLSLPDLGISSTLYPGFDDFANPAFANFDMSVDYTNISSWNS